MNSRIDLFRPYLAPRAVERIGDVLRPDRDGRLMLGQGAVVDDFERELAVLLGVADADTVVSTNSCTSALGIALQLADVGPGDDVIAPPMTCTATSGAIVNRGARIVWADVSRRTGLIDPLDVARKITPLTKAIVAVDWGGGGADYAGLRSAAVQPARDVFVDQSPAPAWRIPGHDIPIVQDAAHSLLAFETGTDCYGQSLARVGGDYVCYSFGPIKHLTCMDGGAIVTHRGDAERARLLRWHGLSRRTKADFRCEQPIHEAGTKAHLTDPNAAIGLGNLPDIPWVVAQHRANAAFYDVALRGLPGVTLPPADPGSAWWCYFLLVDDRDRFMAFMASRGIATSRVHGRNDLHPAYSFPNGPLPGVDYYDAHCVAIPVGWWIGPRERLRVAEAVREWARR